MKSPADKKVNNFFSSFKPLAYKKNEVIIRSGDSISQIYYLKKGYVRQYLLTADGEDVTMHIFKPSSFFPIMLVLSNTENKYFFETVTPAKVFIAPKDAVLTFLKKEPDVLFDLTARMSSGIMGLLNKIENTVFKNSHYKVTSLLLYLAKRFGKKQKDSIRIELPITHADLANWIGLQRETVSRKIELLKKKGHLANKNQSLVIHNIKKLEDELSLSSKPPFFQNSVGKG